MLNHLHRVTSGASLTTAEAENAMHTILKGEATTAQIAAFLVALKMKGETAEELTGFAQAMRSKANLVNTGLSLLVDTCGTGGDSLDTFNVSTVTAFVVAGAGIPVAKHGNRSISGKFGSADLMEALGVKIDLPPADAAQAIREVGIGFLFAPHIHPAMRNAAAARAELKMRTAFNLLGPLTNPAGAQIQIAGAPSLQAAALMAQSLRNLNLKRGFVVHGSDGMDEITLTGPTTIWDVHGDQFEVTPESFGLPAYQLDDLRGDPVTTAQAVLEGKPGPARDIVLANASAVLVAAEVAQNWLEGVALAARSIDSGAAIEKLEALRQFNAK